MISNIFKVFFISSSPILEIRGALPLALTFYKLPFPLAFLICFLGNIFPVIFLLFFLEKIFLYFSRYSFFKKVFEWYFKKTDEKFSHYLKKWGKLALVMLVAIPLPFTGAWTGSIAAFLMRFQKKEAFFLISLGVLIAGSIVSLLFYFGKFLFAF